MTLRLASPLAPRLSRRRAARPPRCLPPEKKPGSALSPSSGLSEARPSLALEALDVFALQWAALSAKPPDGRPPVPLTSDDGLSVLYAFLDLPDAFETRSTYFGDRVLDLGQFERFRRVFATPSFQPLLSHERLVVLSTLLVGEREARQRVFVRGARGDTALYTMALRRRLGGLHDGFWFAASLRCDALDVAGPDDDGGGRPPPRLYSS